MPESLADLHNIYVTLLFSKILEKCILRLAMEEITLKTNQYGGVKGCSTAHMHHSSHRYIWQNMRETAEDYRSATVLTAVVFDKAFNRMSFQHCLHAIKKKGSSTDIIRMIAT